MLPLRLKSLLDPFFSMSSYESWLKLSSELSGPFPSSSSISSSSMSSSSGAGPMSPCPCSCPLTTWATGPDTPWTTRNVSGSIPDCIDTIDLLCCSCPCVVPLLAAMMAVLSMTVFSDVADISSVSILCLGALLGVDVAE